MGPGNEANQTGLYRVKSSTYRHGPAALRYATKLCIWQSQLSQSKLDMLHPIADASASTADLPRPVARGVRRVRSNPLKFMHSLIRYHDKMASLLN